MEALPVQGNCITLKIGRFDHWRPSNPTVQQVASALSSRSDILGLIDIEVLAGSSEFFVNPNGMANQQFSGGYDMGPNTKQYTWDSWNRLSSCLSGTDYFYYSYDHRTRRVVSTESVQSVEKRIHSYSGGTSVNNALLTPLFPNPDPSSGGTVGVGSDSSGTTYTYEPPVPQTPIDHKARVEETHLQPNVITEYDIEVENIRGSDWGGGVGGILYTSRANEVSWAHYNGRGDVVSRTASTGSLTYSASYEAYGTRTQEAGANPDRQRANTKEEDPTGLLNEGFRYRDLELGMFISRDPAGFVDGPNVYTYVVQNPWTNFDPDGLFMKFVGEWLAANLGPPPAIVQTMATHAPAVVGAVRTINDVASMAPGLGKVADLSNGFISAAEGNYGQAAMDAGGGKLGDLAGGAVKAVGGAITSVVAKNADEAAAAISKKADDVMESAETTVTKSADDATTASAREVSGEGAETAGTVIPGACFVAGTLIETQEGGRAIENLRVGDRVLTTECDSSTEVDSATWRKISLLMPNPECPTDILELELLRSPEWIASTGCQQGEQIWFELEEMGLRGWAEVRNVDECPQIQLGRGRVVLATVTHYNTFVMDVRLEGIEEPLRPTDRHRLFSVTRNDWVATSTLTVGELLRTADGTVKIESIRPWPGMHRVFNIEVETEHSYFVGYAKVLSHNENPCAAKGGAYKLEDEAGNVKRTGRSRDLNRRKGNHANAEETKELNFVEDIRSDDYDVQRGAEYRLEQAHPEAKSENGGLNKIKSISDKNPKKQQYIDADKAARED